jgi:uncharacterized protein (DUF2235 family)
MKRLAVFLDGTWEVSDSDTNVWRLRCLCSPKDESGVEQLTYYDPGVGTTFGTRLRGGAFGYGIDMFVCSAYDWLMEKYVEGDELFIFGFSRGAFAARSLSGLISRCGLTIPGSPLSVGQLYRRYQKNDQGDHDPLTLPELVSHRNNGRTDFSPEELWMLAYSRIVPIKFTGVWETVGALGKFPPFLWWLSGGDHDFLDTNLRQTQQYVFHALAVDEHTKVFRPTLLTHYVYTNPDAENVPDRPLSEVEQRWFIGSHGNVGGGSDMNLLAEVPFSWLAKKAVKCGLELQNTGVIDKDANLAALEDSYSQFVDGWYSRFVRPFYRVIGAPPQQHSRSVSHVVNETIDASVFDRWLRLPTYRPPNLTDWAARYHVNIADLKQSVLACNPAEFVAD